MNLAERKKYNKEYRLKYPEKFMEYDRRRRKEKKIYNKIYKTKHREEIKKYNKNYSKKNKTKTLNRVKKYYIEHTDERKKYNKNWRINHKDKIKELNRKRRTRKLSCNGSHTEQEWQQKKKEYNYRCVYCGIHESILKNKYKDRKWWKLTEDHVIALTKGGSDYINNIVPACIHCNSTKYNNLINKKYDKPTRTQNHKNNRSSGLS